MAVAKCFARIISLFRSGWAIWGSMQNWILAKDASQVKIKIDCLTLFFCGETFSSAERNVRTSVRAARAARASTLFIATFFLLSQGVEICILTIIGTS